MGSEPDKAEKHDDTKVRIIWDRYDVYQAVAAVVRGLRIGPRRVAFYDRAQGILPTIPSICEGHVVEAWPRSKRADNLATMSLSINPTDRRTAQAIVATRFGGTFLDPAKPCYVYLLTSPEQSDQLDGPVPVGDFVPGKGQVNWAVTWDQLLTATSVTDLRSRGESE